LIQDYEERADEIVRKVTADNLAVAVELAALPQQIRGYGPVKARYAAHAKKREAALMRRFAETSLKSTLA
jgi:indolepyruvate ferredoxin oxidoreductase